MTIQLLTKPEVLPLHLYPTIYSMLPLPLIEVDEGNKDIKFTNITDKGYRCRMAAWRTGKQLLLQPFFAKADRKFSSKEVLASAKIASHRSGNERAVKVAKRAGKIARGAVGPDSFEDLDDLWLCWGFQANFMYQPVL